MEEPIDDLYAQKLHKVRNLPPGLKSVEEFATLLLVTYSLTKLAAGSYDLSVSE
jgi:hypothetical protein